MVCWPKPDVSEIAPSSTSSSNSGSNALTKLDLPTPD
ncbi:Uncharacterised protein [Vibrio cholerae]|nr:Uncharacterised protein [Vibrio cholerae]